MNFVQPRFSKTLMHSMHIFQVNPFTRLPLKPTICRAIILSLLFLLFSTSEPNDYCIMLLSIYCTLVERLNLQNACLHHF